MKLLLLGGTVFLGRHLAAAARARGHAVSVFHRGLHPADPAVGVEDLRGDRDGDLTALIGRRWDAVIDTSGYVPRVVGASARLLTDAVGHYTFLSSVAVYPGQAKPGVTEDAPVGTLADETVEEKTPQTYGPLKVLCERAVEGALPGRALIVRSGTIAGPFDPTDRFTYWPHRIARGGPVLAPGRPERRVQIIDVADLAEWILLMVEAARTGVYNAVGPAEPLTMAGLLEACRAVSGSDAAFTWVSEEFLRGQKVAPYTEMPLWLPGVDDGIDSTKAVRDGLAFRPLAGTIRDTLAWDATRPADVERIRGLKPGREDQLRTAWATWPERRVGTPA